ncbi:hypothetical protein HNP84_009196 [Thermocatellispora tengchongensis]|uniref:Uncharacterized protein n=1 Tax=Thermocatellispora tengchongensis TaxID=1073253 RepID=A0A840PN31_9ACTN|nr:hypothetical protein [Thermocatellispora tengchongensis]MBB5139433.1 hypothetical protein [Thermocatellispora tengchongensis]
MRTLRSILAGTAIVGSLAAGVALAPAAANAETAVTTATAQASAPKFHNFKYFSDFGRGESFGKRSYFKGFWYKKDGWYYVKGSLFDLDRDREYSYFWVKYIDRFGRTHFDRYKTFGKFDYNKKFFKAKHFWVGVSEGDGFRDDFSGYRQLW